MDGGLKVSALTAAFVISLRGCVKHLLATCQISHAKRDRPGPCLMQAGGPTEGERGLLSSNYRNRKRGPRLRQSSAPLPHSIPASFPLPHSLPLAPPPQLHPAGFLELSQSLTSITAQSPLALHRNNQLNRGKGIIHQLGGKNTYTGKFFFSLGPGRGKHPHASARARRAGWVPSKGLTLTLPF